MAVIESRLDQPGTDQFLIEHAITNADEGQPATLPIDPLIAEGKPYVLVGVGHKAACVGECLLLREVGWAVGRIVAREDDTLQANVNAGIKLQRDCVNHMCDAVHAFDRRREAIGV